MIATNQGLANHCIVCKIIVWQLWVSFRSNLFKQLINRMRWHHRLFLHFKRCSKVRGSHVERCYTVLYHLNHCSIRGLVSYRKVDWCLYLLPLAFILLWEDLAQARSSDRKDFFPKQTKRKPTRMRNANVNISQCGSNGRFLFHIVVVLWRVQNLWRSSWNYSKDNSQISLARLTCQPKLLTWHAQQLTEAFLSTTAPVQKCNLQSECHEQAKCFMGHCICQNNFTGNGNFVEVS